MLFVPAVVLGVLAVVGYIYQKRTGKPFIAYDNGKPELWKMQPDDDIQDVVTLDELEGLWSMVSVGRNGKFAPPDVIQQSAIAIAIVADTLTVTNTLKLSTVKINSDVIPNELDQTSEDGDVHLCIVRIRNGMLEICQAEAGKQRPKDFSHQGIDGASLTLFQKTMSASEMDADAAV